MVCPNKLLLQQFLSMYVEVILVAIPLNALKKAKSVISNQLILLGFIYWDFFFTFFTVNCLCVCYKDKEKQVERERETAREGKKEQKGIFCLCLPKTTKVTCQGNVVGHFWSLPKKKTKMKKQKINLHKCLILSISQTISSIQYFGICFSN